MNSLIETVVAKILSPYLEGISRENLTLGILSGKVSLKNLKVKPSILDDLKIHQLRIVSAIVDSVQVDIPWKNPLGGKIIIDVSGVHARLAFSQNPSHDQLVASKRNAIDVIKKKLVDDIQNKADFIQGDSYTAKFVRKLINSLSISVREIEISLVLLHSLDSLPSSDVEGFADAASQCSNSPDDDPCEIMIQLEEFGLSELIKPETKLSLKAMSKQFAISGVSVFLAGRPLLPPTSLFVDLVHNPSDTTSSSFLSLHVHGLDRCDIRIDRSQLVKLKESLFGNPTNVETIPMTNELRRRYNEEYSKKSKKVEDYYFVFSAQDLAKAELLVDSPTPVTAPQVTAPPHPWWKLGFGASSESTPDSTVEKFRKDFLAEIESTKDEVPGLISFQIDIGKDWTVQLVQNSNVFVTVHLWGGQVRCDVTTGEEKGFDLRIISAGLSICQGTETPILDFREQTVSFDKLTLNASKSMLIDSSLETSSAFMDAQESTGPDYFTYTAADIHIMYKKSLAEAEMVLAVSIQPLTVTFQPGLIEYGFQYFSFLSDPIVVDSLEELIKNRDAILTRGKELIDSVQESNLVFEALSVQTYLTLNLNISGPLLVLPSDVSGDQQIVISLGEMMINLPRSCISDTDKPPIYALLEKISIACVVTDTPDDDAPEPTAVQTTAIQVLSPTALEITLSHEPGIVQLDVNMNEEIAFRISPEIISVILKFISGIRSELNTIPKKVGVTVDLSTANVMDEETSPLSLPFSSTVAVKIKNFLLVLSDGALDVVSFETSVPNLSLTYNGDISGSLERARFVARNYNAGSWEPILEPSYFSGFYQITKSDITVRMRAVSPVNAVLTTSVLRTGLWISRMLENQEENRGTSKRFRIINSTNVTVFISIRRSSGRQPKIIAIAPSSSPTYIDHWVLAYSAKEVFLSTKDDPKKLAKLTIHSSVSTDILRIPLDKGYCETLAPVLVQSLSMGDTSAVSSRCILISYGTFLFNQCDVPLIVRGVGRSPLPTPLSYLIGVPSLAGAGSVKTVSSASSVDEQTKIRADQVILQPGTFISVPEFPESNRWSVSDSDFHHQPINLDSIEFARRASTTEPPNLVFNIDCGNGFNIRTDGMISETDYPYRGDLRNIFFRPPLVVSNSTPCSLRLSHSQKLSIFSLLPGESRNVHDISAVDDLTKMTLNLSFINIESEWSNCMFGPFAANPVAKDQPLLIREGSQSPGRKAKKSIKITKFEERYMLSPEVNRVHPVHLTATASNAQSVNVSVKWWLVDRTGLNLTVYGNNSLPLPRADNNGPVWLLPDPDTPITLKVFRGRSDYVQVTLPDSGWFDAKIGHYPLVFVSRESFVEKFVEIVPKYTVFNGLVDRPIFITNCFSDVVGDEDMLAPRTGTVLMSDTFQFSVQVRANPQSVPIPMKESFAGVWPLDVDGSGNVVRVEIAPDCGSICVSIFAGSSVVVRNEKRKHSVAIMVDNGNFFEVSPLTERPIGWRDPFSHPQIETTMRILGEYFGGPNEFKVPLARAGDEIRYGGCVNVVAANEPQSITIVVEKSHRDSYHQLVCDSDQPQRVLNQRIIRLEFEANAISCSIVHQNKEVLYAELSLLKFLVLQDTVLRRISTMISDIQVDTCVSRKPTSNPVILINKGDSSRAFLEFTIDQNTNVSYGVSLIPMISIQLDNLLIEVDSKFMIALDDLVNDLINITSFRNSSGRKNIAPIVPGIDILPVKKGTVVPIPAPPILILDVFEFGQISIRLWVDFALKTMAFMPISLKLVVGVLSLGKSFKLDGAPVVLKRRNITGYKGSLIAFKDSVVDDYANEALLCCATLLGSSSLLAIPRAPIHLITNVGAFGLEKATKAVGGIGDFISEWTSDEQYRDAQAKIRANKNIRGIGDGFIEGATRLGEGAEGFLDIFRKPVQGAKSGGCVGCLKGFGRGLVGSIFKPITKVGEAVSDVGTGIARTVKPSSSSKRVVLHRKRIPRPLYGRNRSTIGDYNELDAIVISKLSKELTKGIDVILPLTASPDSSTASSCLILYPRKIAVVQLVFAKPQIRRNSQSFGSSRSQISLLSSDTADYSRIVAVSVEREIPAKDIRIITPIYHSNSIVVEDQFGVELTLRLQPTGSTLLGSIETAVATGVGRGYVDWSETKQIYNSMIIEDRDRVIENKAADQTEEGEKGMTKTVEVFEVERFLMTYGWTTPYMVLDSGNEAWRWLDKTMSRHSKIRPRLSRKDAANSKLPPITVGDLWKPLDEWTVVVDSSTTDAIGWQYAISFNSSTWYARPGITASVRRRKWVRHYS